jgi:putative transposase
MQEAYRLSERKAARLIGLPRGTMRYREQRDPQTALRLRLKELAASRVRFGYRRLTVLWKREGFQVNAKRIYRLYKEENLTVRTKSRKKLASRTRVPLAKALRPNQRWSMDFIHERTEDGRSFRVLSIIDQFTRECIALVADRPMTGAKVVVALEQAIQQGRPKPESITTDNGSEFVGKALDSWAVQQRVQLDFIRPGRPVENSYVESFHGRLRDECLNAEIFFSLADAQSKLNRWREDYNHRRPHSALGDRPPALFADHQPNERNSRFALLSSNTASGSPPQGSATPAAAALDPGSRQLDNHPSRGRSAAAKRLPNQSLFLDFPDTLKRPLAGPPRPS